MKIKNKLAFVAMISIIDLIVVVFVITNNGKTNIKNDISNKTAANIVATAPVINNEITEDIQEKIEEQPDETKEVEQIVETQEENNENIDNNQEINNQEAIVEEQPQEEQTPIENNISYDEMTLEQKVESLNSGTLSLVYSDSYTTSNERLTKSKGVVYYNDHKETYYDEKVLPGSGLRIPGRHVAEDGTIRDEEGYICVAANQEYMAKGTVLITSLGPAKVYDTGCAYGTIDIYVNW